MSDSVSDAAKPPLPPDTVHFDAFISYSLNGVTDVWQARTGRVLNVIRGPAPPAGMFEERMGGAISPDDQYVVTTSGGDNDAHVYRVGQPGEVLALQGHSDGVDDATFSPDGTLIATTAGHGICTTAAASPTCDNSTRAAPRDRP